MKGTVVLYYFWKFRDCTLVGCWITELQRGHKSPCLGSSWGFPCKVIQVFTFYMNSSCRGKAISVALWIFHRKIKKLQMLKLDRSWYSNEGAEGPKRNFVWKGQLLSTIWENFMFQSQMVLQLQCSKKGTNGHILPHFGAFCEHEFIFSEFIWIDFVNTRRPVSRFWKLIQK